MASNTDTLPPKATTTGQAQRPPKARHGTLAWAAVTGACIAAVALAVATLTGSDDSDTPATRLDPRVEQYERQAHLDGQAKTYGHDSGATTHSEAGNRAAQQAQAERYVDWLDARADQAVAARRMAEAERIERQAHLEGQARTYGQRPAHTPAPANEADTPEPQFIPGSRHVPTR